MKAFKQIMAQLQWWRHSWPNDCIGRPLHYDACQHIGILTVGERHLSQLANNLILQLQQDNKIVHNLCFLNHEAIRWDEKIHVRTFSPKDLRLSGLIQSHTVERFLTKPYDLLINTSAVMCPFIEQIMARSKTHLRIGLHAQEREKYYDFLVKETKAENSLKSLYDYLSKL